MPREKYFKTDTIQSAISRVAHNYLTARKAPGEPIYSVLDRLIGEYRLGVGNVSEERDRFKDLYLTTLSRANDAENKLKEKEQMRLNLG